jgi:hypothetical protein
MDATAREEMATAAGSAFGHYSNAQELMMLCDAWLPAAHRVQDHHVPHLLARAQVEATLAVAEELRALRLSRHLR